MREILFRGKTKGNVNTKDGEWVYGLPFYNSNGIIDGIESKDGKLYYVIPETVGQFTGSTDKNGKKIFEGDIVKYVFGKENGKENREILIALWDKEYCSFMLEEQRTKQRIDLCEFEKTEVIGNIHDNPELLEVAK